MSLTASASTPRSDHDQSSVPLLGGTQRALCLVGGIAFAALAFVVVGVYAAVLGCTGSETSGLCVHHASLVPVLEWPIFALSVLAPLAGGIACVVRRRAGWLGIGITLGFAMFGLMIAVSQGQSGLMG